MKDKFTVGQLLDFIEKHKISRDAEVFYQRIEDVYFEKMNWTTVKKEGFTYNHYGKSWNDDIDSGKFLNKEDYPGIEPEKLKKWTNEELEKMKDEYIHIFCPVKYRDDDNLYLDAHY